VSESSETPRSEGPEPDEEALSEEEEREAQGEDPTSPARGFDSVEDVERHDAEQQGPS
jgi:hypothetical protein